MINWYQHGFELVGTAKNGANALDMVEQYSPDIVFTDLKMPQMDGLELIRQLKRRRYRGKIVALTNYAEYELIREAMVLGASDYLLKVALNPDDLLVVLNKMMTKLSDERRQIEEDIRQEMTQRERQAIMKNMFLEHFCCVPRLRRHLRSRRRPSWASSWQNGRYPSSIWSWTVRIRCSYQGSMPSASCCRWSSATLRMRCSRAEAGRSWLNLGLSSGSPWCQWALIPMPKA